MTPLLGFNAPNRAYPAITHARAFAAHLVYGRSGHRRRGTARCCVTCLPWLPYGVL